MANRSDAQGRPGRGGGIGRTECGPSSAERDTAQQALARARAHAGRAVGEALEAARALLDAVSLAAGGVPSVERPGLRGLAVLLEQGAATLGDAAAARAPLGLDALVRALDTEIGRWESRSFADPDARAVLRALLGLRELLWELGLRPPATPPRPSPRRSTREPDVRRRASQARPRVERVPIRS